MTKDEYTFNPGDFVVYPARGVGQITEIKSEDVCGQQLDIVSVNFNKDRATVKIPLSKIKKDASSLRQISTPAVMADAVKVLKGKAKVRRVQWSRRSQEYTDKIKSTSRYIGKIINRIVLLGALLLSVVALFPIIFSQVTSFILAKFDYAQGMNISLGGTSIIILVGVALETVKQLESQMMMRHYKGFLD